MYHHLSPSASESPPFLSTDFQNSVVPFCSHPILCSWALCVRWCHIFPELWLIYAVQVSSGLSTSTIANPSGQANLILTIAVASPTEKCKRAENAEQLHGDRAVRKNTCHNQMAWNQHFQLKPKVWVGSWETLVNISLPIVLSKAGCCLAGACLIPSPILVIFWSHCAVGHHSLCGHKSLLRIGVFALGLFKLWDPGIPPPQIPKKLSFQRYVGKE